MINQQIRLIRQLGAGGMSSVWAAEHLRLGVEVAVKFLSPQHLHDPSIRERFQREARAISQTRSPHVVQVLDQGVTEDGVPYLVLELLDGENLGQYLARVDHVRLAEAGAIIEQLCRALSKAHRTGVIHRDIKPDNVFLVREPDGPPFVKLLDFGIAKDLAAETGGITNTGSWLGSAYYMSPEQLRDPKRVDALTDVWAVSALIYQLLTGNVPFDGDSWAAICGRVCVGQFEPVSRLGLGLPLDLDAFFARGLRVEKSERFQSIDELWKAFEHILSTHTSMVIEKRGPAESFQDTLPGLADRPFSQEIARAPARRRTAWLVLAGLLLGALGVVLWRAVAAPQQPMAAPARAPRAAAVTDTNAITARAPEPAPPPAAVSDNAPAPHAPPPVERPAPAASVRAPQKTRPPASNPTPSGRKYRGF